MFLRAGVKTVTPSEVHHLSPGGARRRRLGRRFGAGDGECAAGGCGALNTMSAEEEFKANVQDIFFDYDNYDIRTRRAGHAGQGCHYLLQPSRRSRS